MTFSLFDKTKIPLLSKALGAYSLRHKVIASNIANIGTVGYRSQSVTFEEELAGAMQGSSLSGTQTDPRHIPIATRALSQVVPRVVESNNLASEDPMASGVNNVDIDYEMAELAKNQIRFKLAARLLADTFKGIQKSIRGQL